jgi:hypothetical protein
MYYTFLLNNKKILKDYDKILLANDSMLIIKSLAKPPPDEAGGN